MFLFYPGMIWGDSFIKEVDTQKFRFTPLAGPGYTPEMGFVLGGGFLMSWYPGDDPSSITRSSMPVMFTVATVGGYTFSAKPQTFWLEDKLRADLEFRLRDINDNYWGIGYENGINIEKGSDTTEYKQTTWSIYPTVRWLVHTDLYAGASYDIGIMSADDVNPVMQEDPDFQAAEDSIFFSGAGLVLQYDNRDFPQNAFDGMLLELKAAFYSEVLGSDNTYQKLSFDYRQYERFPRKGSILAWQVSWESAFGDIPWSAYPQVGSPSDLRGYYRGRFRDAFAMWGLVEYRHTFSKSKSEELSKLGFVTWAGLGTMGSGIASLDGILPNLGSGIRFEVQPRLNVRFDVGWGLDTFGLYFNFQEAF